MIGLLLRTGVLHAIDLGNVRLCQRPNRLRAALESHFIFLLQANRLQG